jgi:perosamine synthetase
MRDRRPIAISTPDLSDLERTNLLQAFDSSWISSQGRFVSRFEENFAEFVGTAHGISCTNGTCALHLSLLALGVGRGDEVIVPDLTYVSTANAVRYVGADPVFADCRPDTWNVDPESVRRLLSDRTGAIIAVHHLAVPADLGALRRIADEAGCPLIEDAAETPGARWDGWRIGSVGDLSTFSFYGNKIITTGEGGIVCTRDDLLAARVRKLRGQGADANRHYWFDEVGYNYRMTNLACAIGLAQLSRFDEMVARRATVRAWYEEARGEFGAPVDFQHCPPQAEPAWWIVGAVLDESARVDRDGLRRDLDAEGIETRPFFAPMSSLPVYQECRTDNGCPIARRLGKRGVMLPTHTMLEREDVQRVVSTIAAAIMQPAEVGGS